MIRLIRAIPTWLWVFTGTTLLSLCIALTHPKGAVISFDEGFHGGAALYFYELIHNQLLGIKPEVSPHYIYAELRNGVTLYPPLWTVLASGLALLFSPTTFVFRSATSIFYILTILVIYWFVHRESNKRSTAIMAASIVATIPMVVIYSHLMMLELPLMLGVTAMVTAYYLLTQNVLKRNWHTILGLVIVFTLGPLTKLAALPVAWLIIGTYTLTSSILFPRSKQYRNFFKPELIILLVVSSGSLFGVISWINATFQVNMVEFFVGQSQNGETKMSLVDTLLRAWELRTFYLRDFNHIPALTILWFGSTLAYFLWKRTPLGLLLLVWAVCVYVSFTGVQPQVPQYIMPIYAPLGIATALFLSELATKFGGKKGLLYAVLGVISIILLQCIALPKSEGYGWRTNIHGQEHAADIIARDAKNGDRVLTWHDGDTYAIRIATLNKRLQIINGNTQTCPAAMRDSIDWALTVNEPPYISQLDRSTLTQSPWEKVTSFGSDDTTILYRNRVSRTPQLIEGESYNPNRTITDRNASGQQALIIDHDQTQPAVWGCLRLLPIGKSYADISLKALDLPKFINNEEGVARIEYSSSNKDELTGITITAAELRRSRDYQTFRLELNHLTMNLAGEFVINIYRPVTLHFDSILITPTS